MKWLDSGPKLTGERVRLFESQTGVTIPEPVIWLLRNITNGGAPDPEPELVSVGSTGKVEFDVHGIYGVDHPLDYYDLKTYLDDIEKGILQVGFPIGYDSGDGAILYILEGPHVGQVHYIPWDELAHPGYNETYFVASDMKHFVSLMEAACKGS